MLVGQRISQIPPYGLQNYIAGILAALERICHCDRHGLFTLSVLIPNVAMKPFLQRVEDLTVQELIAQLGVEALAIAVLTWESPVRCTVFLLPYSGATCAGLWPRIPGHCLIEYAPVFPAGSWRRLAL